MKRKKKGEGVRKRRKGKKERKEEEEDLYYITFMCAQAMVYTRVCIIYRVRKRVRELMRHLITYHSTHPPLRSGAE